jgi:2-methylisocitrate lyase-like PEP mutase family enzyme
MYAMLEAASTKPRRILWQNVSTVLSAAILISAEVFGAAFAGGWAVANLVGLGDYGVYALQIVFFLLGLFVMASFVRNAMRIEPFTTSS